MKKEYEFKSNAKATVTVEKDIIRISRKGFRSFVTQGLKGEKSIPIRNITAIQVKKPGMTTGYIQFAQHGMMEGEGGVFESVKDENSIIFGKKDYDKALELKEYIESVQDEQNSQSTGSKSSEADELEKFKQLADDGVITQEDFEAKKKQILGI